MVIQTSIALAMVNPTTRIRAAMSQTEEQLFDPGTVKGIAIAWSLIVIQQVVIVLIVQAIVAQSYLMAQ